MLPECPALLRKLAVLLWQGGRLCAEGMEEPFAAQCCDSGSAFRHQSRLKSPSIRKLPWHFDLSCGCCTKHPSSLSLPSSGAEHRCSFVCSERELLGSLFLSGPRAT